jgi:hypothetical protein
VFGEVIGSVARVLPDIGCPLNNCFDVQLSKSKVAQLEDLFIVVNINFHRQICLILLDLIAQIDFALALALQSDFAAAAVAVLLGYY